MRHAMMRAALLSALSAFSGSLQAESFRIAVIPDTQMYTVFGDYMDPFDAQTQWIRDHVSTHNIKFVSHMGDVTQGTVKAGFITLSKHSRQFEHAQAAMSLIGTSGSAVVPYSVCIGNHDWAEEGNKNSDNSQWRSYYGSSRYQNLSWYGGTYTVTGSAAKSNLSHYQYFEAAGRRFLHLNLEYDPAADVLAWAQSIIDANLGLPTIISTHAYIQDPDASGNGGGRSGIGEKIWNGLVKNNAQIFMTLNGHYHRGTDTQNGEYSLVSTNAAGLPVYQMQSNYQGYYSLDNPDSLLTGGEGFMRLVEFNTDTDRINVVTYNPLKNTYQTDANSQFSFAFDLDQRFPIPEPASLSLLVMGAMALSLRRTAH